MLLFLLNRFGLELIIFFWNSSQLSVQFWDCRLLQLSVPFWDCRFTVGLQVKEDAKPYRWERQVAHAITSGFTRGLNQGGKA